MFSNYTTQSVNSQDNSLLDQINRRLEFLEGLAHGTFHDPNTGSSYGSTYNNHDYTYHMDPQFYSSSPHFDYMPHYPSYEQSHYYPDACQQEPPTNFSSSQFMSPVGQPIYNQNDNVNSSNPTYDSTYYGMTQQIYMEPDFNESNDTWGTNSYQNYPPSYLETNHYENYGPPSVNPVSHQFAYTPDQDEMDWILSLPLPECISRPSRINESCESVTPDVLYIDDPSFSSDINYDETPLANSSPTPILSSPIMLHETTDQLLCSHNPEYVHYNENEEVFPLPHDESSIPPILETKYYEDELYERNYISFHQSIISPSIETNNYEDECNEDETLIELSAENIVTTIHESSLESPNHQLDLIPANLGPHHIYDLHVLPIDTYLAHDPYLREMSHQHLNFHLHGRIYYFDALIKLCAQSNLFFKAKAEHFNFFNFNPCYIFSSNLAGTWLKLKNIFIFTLYIYIPPPGDFPLFLLVYDLHCFASISLGFSFFLPSIFLFSFSSMIFLFFFLFYFSRVYKH